MIFNKVIVALDSDNLDKSIKLVSLLKNDVYAFKIGYEFFYNFGISGYSKIYKICPKIFLDLKLHDIPNTVRKGLLALYKLNPVLTTIHISGGDEMMKSTLKNKRKTKVIGVSILTSLDKFQTNKYYNKTSISLLVKNFVKEAKKNKLDGIVCSPKEIKDVRKIAGNNFLIITPGIRTQINSIKKDDQKRVTTPKKAIDLGADLIVIGRPITESKNPIRVLKEINKTLS